MTRIEGPSPQSSPAVEAEPTSSSMQFGRLARIGTAAAAPVLVLALNQAPAYAPVSEAPPSELPPTPYSTPKPSGPPPPNPKKPNILNVVIDDMNDFSCGQLDEYMPKTSQWLVRHRAGTCFENTQSSAPQCSPSRGSIMTGAYPHNDLLKTQQDFANLNLKHTLQSQLRNRGYTTFGDGKWLNGASSRNVNMHPGSYGFDEATFWDAYRYNGYSVYDHEGHRKVVQENSASYVGQLTRQAIKQAASDNKPWYVYEADRPPHNPMDGTSAPHPTKEHLNSPVPPLEFHHERDLSDKLSLFTERYLDVEGPYLPFQNMRREQSVLDVDSQLVRTLHLLGRLGVLKNTVVVFSSDNGWENGNHGWLSKDDPYRGATEVPMFWIANKYMNPGVDQRLVSNIDIAPTLLKIAGIKPNHVMDGHSLLSDYSRKLQYTEYFHEGKDLPQPSPGNYTVAIPTWSKINNKKWSYLTYYAPDGHVIRHEYYKTPLELEDSFASLPKQRKEWLAERLHDLRVCAGTIQLDSPQPCT